MNRFTYPGPGAFYSYHNHSSWSDGASTMEEMCRAAKAAGLKEFGLSDHYVIHPDKSLMPLDWSMPVEKVGEYIAELQKLKQQLDDENFCIRIGLEVDFFFENYQEVLADLEKYPLDYLIGSVHYSGTFPIDNNISFWKGLSEQRKDEICTIYWQKLLGAAQCGKFLFLGHLDLPKKFGQLKDPAKYLPEARKVLDAAAESNTAVELNTAGWLKECAEQYPSEQILREAAARRIPVVINPDAHSSALVACHFERAAEMLKKIQS